MVTTPAPTTLAALPQDDDVPGHSGTLRNVPPLHPPPHQFPHDEGSHDPAAAQASPQLNPAALTQRLLNTIGHTNGVSPRENAFRSNSVPNLPRAHVDDSSSPANLDPETIEKVQRTHSYVPSRDHAFSLTSATPLAPGASGAQQPLGVPGHATPIIAPPRQALLSKKLLEPKKPVGKNPTFKQSLYNTVTYSWLNVLFVFVPIAWGLELSHAVSDTIVFVFSFLAIVPCAAALGFATEELALRVGDALGGLLNATFGNAVELLISILALVRGDLDIVRSSMLGSILSNCLLVLGGCFFAGGIKFFEQGYSTRAAQLNINLLGIAVTAIVVPVAFHYFIASEASGQIAMADDAVLRLSRGISFILLFVYACYLFFQLWTHSYLYVPAPPRDPRIPLSAAALAYNDGPQPPTEGRVFRLPSWGSSTSSGSSRAAASLREPTTRSRASSVAHPTMRDFGDEEAGIGQEGVVFNATDAQADAVAMGEKGDLEQAMAAKEAGETACGHEVEVPKLSPWFAMGLLVVTTGVTGLTAEFLIGSIDGLTEGGNISREFVALILLPVVGNAAEHVTAITVATKNKLDLSIAVAVGSSIQIALFVIPVLILIAWAIGQPLDLLFDPFETLLVFLCIASVNWAIGDGRTQWMEGMALICAYLVIALCAWYYPGVADI